MRRALWAGVLAAAWVGCPKPVTPVSGEWGAGEIAWRTFDDGQREATQQHRPICLVFFTTWCPHCKNYAKLFGDPKVVERAKAFVMVRVDNDRDKALAARFSPDGQYIPRTYFLSSQGVLDPTLVAQQGRYRYFYDESDPTALLEGMGRALTRLQ